MPRDRCSRVLLLELRLSTGLLMLLKFRPASAPRLLLNCLRLPMIALVSVEPHRAFSGSSLRMSAVVPRVEVAIGARRFDVVHLH